MKQMVCEMCGGIDLLKQDGYFVCQSCGTKYTVEEARKMMIEGTVDVQGTVKVDNSAFVEKYLANARRSFQKEDWEGTERYYNMVEQNDPNNIEAIFYSAYGRAKASLLDNNIAKRTAAFNPLITSVSIIDDQFLPEREGESRETIARMSADIFAMAESKYIYNTSTNGYGGVTDDRHMTMLMFWVLQANFAESLYNIAEKISYEEKEKRIFYYNLAIQHYEHILKSNGSQNSVLTKETKEKYIAATLRCHSAKKQVDPTHIMPTRENLEQLTKMNDSAIKKENRKRFLIAFAIAFAIGLSISIPLFWGVYNCSSGFALLYL